MTWLSASSTKTEPQRRHDTHALIALLAATAVKSMRTLRPCNYYFRLVGQSLYSGLQPPPSVLINPTSRAPQPLQIAAALQQWQRLALTQIITQHDAGLCKQWLLQARPKRRAAGAWPTHHPRAPPAADKCC